MDINDIKKLREKRKAIAVEYQLIPDSSEDLMDSLIEEVERLTIARSIDVSLGNTVCEMKEEIDAKDKEIERLQGGIKNLIMWSADEKEMTAIEIGKSAWTQRTILQGELGVHAQYQSKLNKILEVTHEIRNSDGDQ